MYRKTLHKKLWNIFERNKTWLSVPVLFHGLTSRRDAIQVENQSTKNSQSTLKKEWCGRRALLDIKTHYKAKIILKAWYWHKDRPWSRIELDAWLMAKIVPSTLGRGQSSQSVVPDQLDGVIEEKGDLVTTSRQSTVDFVRGDTGMVALSIKGVYRWNDIMSGTSNKISKKKIKGKMEENRKTRTGKMLIHGCSWVWAGVRLFSVLLYVFERFRCIKFVVFFLNQFQVAWRSNVKGSIIKLREGYIGEYLHTPKVGKDFWNMTQKWLVTQEEGDKLDYIKIKNCCVSKKPFLKVKSKLKMWTYITNKGLHFGIYGNPYKSIRKITQ